MRRQRLDLAIDRHAQEIGTQANHSVVRIEAGAHGFLVARQGTEIGRMVRWEMRPLQHGLIIDGATRRATQRQRAAERLAELSGRNWTANRKARADVASAKAAMRPIDPKWPMLTIADLLPQDAIIVDDALTTGASLPTFMHLRDRFAYFGDVSGGIGWAIAAAVGIQLALPERKVIALLGDGSAMYSIQALWTAAHQKLPTVFVVFNNGGYRIIKQRLKLFHSTERFIGMDFVDPAIEFAALARSLGMRAHRIDTGDEFGAAYRDALAAREPVLLEVIVDRQRVAD